MKLALELPVASELDKDHLIQQEADKVEGLRDMSSVVASVGHLGESADALMAGEMWYLSGLGWLRLLRLRVSEWLAR